ncbi:hypothetical protein [Lacrimispora sphenoides]|uniref:hypothetical protein n=1 Tax=Lacrimispora sphenoides TaxID=29370 RepID=UPI000AD18AB7|nr:hypothetical protein [Lacrimispora sphenoides]
MINITLKALFAVIGNFSSWWRNKELQDNFELAEDENWSDRVESSNKQIFG